jgi:hypothetical protein
MNTHKHTKPKAPQPNFVQDRKTGEWYDPKARFDELMNKPAIIESFKRLSLR